MRALIWVQHLLGTGHVVRAMAIGRALVERGVETVLASGAALPPTLDRGAVKVVDLPSARARDASFSTLIDDRGRPLDDAWRARRSAMTLDLLHSLEPDILVTECFPFGRRQFRFELLPVVRAAAAMARPPLVAASVRDILVRKADPAKERQMAELAREHYDMVLVHADPRLVRFDRTFPAAGRIADLLRHTGYVHGAGGAMPPAGEGIDEVIVSCGGGAVGKALLETAIAARRLSQEGCRRSWRILAGGDIDAETLADLAERAGPGMVVERARPDFAGLLRRAAASISQAGYNTVLDVLTAGVAAVLVPFGTAAETEQTERARLIAEKGLAQVVSEEELTPERLARALDRALDEPRQRFEVDVGGARKSAEMLIAAALEKEKG